MTLGIRYAARSDVGMLREGNEDSAYAGARLIAVADGMGGHAGGEVASAAAINTIRKLDTDVPAPELLSALEHAVHEANANLHTIVEGDPSLQGMGTTLTAMLWSGSHIAMVHIGDSRAYLLRNGELYQITRDHTLVQQLVDEGRISLDEAASHPQRSLLLRALDGRGEVDPDLTLREAQAGDRYLLCSDGLSGVVSAETIHQVLVSQSEPETAIRQLIDLANRGGGPDNITCVVADVIDLTLQPPAGGRPVLAGAAAAAQAGPPVRGGDSPAQRAAEFRDTLPQPAVGPDGMPQQGGVGVETMQDIPVGMGAPAAAPMAPPPGPPPQAMQQNGGGGHRQPRGRRRWTWLIVAVTIFALLVAGGLYVGYDALTSGYYIGPGKGTEKSIVVIYKGDPTNTILGLDLSSKAGHQPGQITISDLPDDLQRQVNGTFSAGSSNQAALAEAQTLQSRLCRYELKATTGADAQVEIFRGLGPDQSGCATFTPIPADPPARLAQLPADQAQALKAGVAASSRQDAQSKLKEYSQQAVKCQQQPGVDGCPGAARPAR
jgi:protein phosphatase